MGNKQSHEGYAGGLADSPTKRLEKFTIFELRVLSYPKSNQLPQNVKAVFTEGHVEFWDMQLGKMFNAVSYYAVASWAHGNEAFNINIIGANDADSKGTFSFKTKKGEGKICAETISGYVNMILADKQYKENDAKMVAKEKKWDEVFSTPTKDNKKNKGLTETTSPLRRPMASPATEELDEFFNGIGSQAQVA
eukprot:TRINITY_DN24930_c0_g1_i2.p1 TRINITY_DN24930_c0_g1~~TRINITY_DN24930_c0_g1_i2.p1  ORF type:complete len:193 (+),score=58.93 TRINITY_DN24930_c0_g1_i2:244-822(+)